MNIICSSLYRYKKKMDNKMSAFSVTQQGHRAKYRPHEVHRQGPASCHRQGCWGTEWFSWLTEQPPSVAPWKQQKCCSLQNVQVGCYTEDEEAEEFYSDTVTKLGKLWGNSRIRNSKYRCLSTQPIRVCTVATWPQMWRGDRPWSGVPLSSSPVPLEMAARHSALQLEQWRWKAVKWNFRQ